MEQLTKLLHNRKLLIGLAAGLGGVLVLMVLILLLIVKTPAQPAPETTAAQTTQAVETTQWTPPENIFGPYDFQFDGDYLTCLSAYSELGVDVCSYQGNIDWEQVAAAGVKFAIIRVGGRGWGPAGTLYVDEYAQRNYEGARAAGLKVGAYFFSQAITVREAQEEAQLVLDTIRDWQLEMPVVFDWELIDPATDPESRTANVDTRTLTDCTLAFCREIEQAGYTPMVYTNLNQYEGRLDPRELMEYPLWVAMYSHRMTFPYRLDMWQYTAEGSVPGIEGPVDLNLYFPQEELS